MTITSQAVQPTLFRTQGGSRLHIAGCPHVRSPLMEVTAADLDARAVCEWCRAELDGVGRTYYSNIDEAMRALGCHVGTHELIRAALADVVHDQIWLPHSRSYIALGRQGFGVAWAGKGYVFVKAASEFIELPGYRPSGGGGGPREDRHGELCGRHFILRALDGSCERCDD